MKKKKKKEESSNDCCFFVVKNDRGVNVSVPSNLFRISKMNFFGLFPEKLTDISPGKKLVYIGCENTYNYVNKARSNARGLSVGYVYEILEIHEILSEANLSEKNLLC